MKANEERAQEFETHRRTLRALAYRMLGSRADAEDIVQDAWLRWQGVVHEEVENVRAFLSRTVTRLCLDRLKSAQAQREIYVGSWLPEPLLDEAAFQPAPDVTHELAQDLSFAFMLTLERLSPAERAAFLLHDVFDMDFAEVAAALGRSEAACRQLASRARSHVRSNRPPLPVSAPDGQRLAQAFAQALQGGDVQALAAVLAEDARFVSDGGGRATSVPRPLVGRDLVAKVLLGFARHYDPARTEVRASRVNGLPGFLVMVDRALLETLALEVEADRIAAIYVVRNPDKLAGIRPA